MSAAAGVAVGIAVFLYIELAIGFGYYMFLLTTKKTPDADEKQKKQIKNTAYSRVWLFRSRWRSS